MEVLETRRLLAAIRVATYNVLQGSPDTPAEQGYYTTILEAIGNETRAGITRPVDLLVLQETDAGSISSLESILDSLYTDDYSTVLSPAYAGLAYGFVYNTATLSLLGATTVSGGGFTRPPLRGHFEPILATTNDADFFVYSAHFKADSGGPDAAIRATEASLLRSDADALGEGENVLIVGDFNMKGSFESAYANLTAAGPGQVHDPVQITVPATWFENSQFIELHSQDPGGGGGMDDRFDLQLISGELLTPGGLDYVAGSYRVFGNNGTHSVNGILTGTGASATVLNALRNASDHLPVVVDYQFDTVTAGIAVVESDGSTTVSEAGATDEYTIVLESVPSGNVTITIDPDTEIDLGAGPGIPIDLTFTTANALIPQAVPVSAVDDLDVEGPHFGLITHSITSSDVEYATLAIDDISVAITDNEPLPPPAVVISEIMYNPATPEGAFSPEWVEIVNVGSVPVDISGWKLDDEDAADWGPIPPATVLQPGQAAILFDGISTPITTVAGFRSAWNVPASALVIGVDWPDLDNDPSGANEVLALKDGSDVAQDLVNFDDEGLWPSDQPEGSSIYLTNLLADNDVGSHWARSVIGVDQARAANGFPFSSSDVGSPGDFPAIPSGPVVTLAGNTQPFTGPGIYTFEFTITADTTPVVVEGFTLPIFNAPGVSTLLDPPPPAGSLSDIEFTPHPALEAKNASQDYGPSFGFSISASDLDNSPLSLGVGQTEVLFSIDVDISGGFVIGDVLTLGQQPLTPLLTITTVGGTGLSVADGEVVLGVPAGVFDLPPTVTDVKVAGSSWNSTGGGLFNFLAAVDPTDQLGYSILNLSSPVPWINVDTIYIEFSKDIGSFDNADFSLGGVPATLPSPLGGPVGDYEAAGLIPPQNVIYDPIAARATITLTEAFQADKLLLSLFATSIQDAAGNLLDGDGDGNGGDDGQYDFAVLPGDAAGGGSVTTDDVTLVRSVTGQVQGLGMFNPFADLDGSGAINTIDVGSVRNLTGTLLPLSPPVAPPALRQKLPTTNLALFNSLPTNYEEAMNSWPDRVDELFRQLQLF